MNVPGRFLTAGHQVEHTKPDTAGRLMTACLDDVLSQLVDRTETQKLMAGVIVGLVRGLDPQRIEAATSRLSNAKRREATIIAGQIVGTVALIAALGIVTGPYNDPRKLMTESEQIDAVRETLALLDLSDAERLTIITAAVFEGDIPADVQCALGLDDELGDWEL